MVNEVNQKSSLDNLDVDAVKSFGDEWSRYDQSEMSNEEGLKIFNDYFYVFPWSLLSPDSEGFDMGCGSGRWAKFVAPRVGKLHCIDPSSALDVARKNLSEFESVKFISSSVDKNPLPPGSQDFGYSLGVLHHVPDTEAAIKSCVDMLKPGAPFLLYLYYSFDNRGLLYRVIWHISDYFRRGIHRLPPGLKNFSTDVIAVLIYYPLARLSFVLNKFGIKASGIPLYYYRNHSFYTMRTDSRDRFGTPLEHRFSREQIKVFMERGGLTEVKFSELAPFWCAVGLKK
jgi:SAM-dependent methyltransferase